MEHKDFFLERRNARGLSQSEVASILGYSPQLISLWESGKAFPDLSIWSKYAKILGVDLSGFLLAKNIKNNDRCETLSFDSNKFSSNLRYLRKKNNLTQVDIAKVTVVNNKTISSWEKGKSFPSLYAFFKLCELLKISEDELYFAYKFDEKVDTPIKYKVKKIFLPIFLPIILVIAVGGTTAGVVTAVNKNRNTIPNETSVESEIESETETEELSTDSSSEEPVDTSYITYQLDEENNAIITSFASDTDEIIVPSSIDGYSITFINSGAITSLSSYKKRTIKKVRLHKDVGINDFDSLLFQEFTLLDEFTIPHNASIVDGHMFENCSSLESVTFNEGLIEIGNDAFKNCGIKEIEIPSSVITIRERAFCYVKADYIYIPKTVTTIDNDAFSSLDEYANIIYCENEYRPSSYSLGWASGSEVIWGYKNEITDSGIKYAIGEVDEEQYSMVVSFDTSIKDIVIPETISGAKVTNISRSCFRDKNKITSVTLPNGVTNIGKSSFNGCSKLKNVTFGNNVKTIGEGAFYNCYDLKELNLPDSVETIGQNAFRGCTSLTELEIPSSIETIEFGTFEDCNGLTKLKICNGTKLIKSYAFFGCGFKTIILPRSIEKLEQEAFGYCHDIEQTFYEGTNDEWDEIDIGPNGNVCILDKPIYFYSEVEPTESGNYWHYIEGEPIVW